ncbi:MAG: hypothetical protein WCL14_10530 [Bacteroidota bacterium]
MILTIHPSHDHNDMSPADLIIFVHNVVVQMNANVATFSDPTVATSALTTCVDDLELKNKAYVDNPKKFSAMDGSKKALLKLVNKENKYIDTVADGEGAIIDLSGFHKTSAESTPTKKPTNAVIKDMHSSGKGNFYVQVNAQGLCTYMFIVCALDATVVFAGHQVSVNKGPMNTYTDTHPFADMHNLPSGDYKLIIVVINRAGMSNPTSPTTISVP